ncbi:MAG: two-CW domain-containing protein [Thermodesulfovibrionales bacterium]
MKKNCWEFKRCGREPGGENASALGVCPASTNTKLEGVYDGKNAGRTCWVIAGTMCNGEVQGIFAQKYNDCRICDFYQKVKEEEGKDFLITVDLIRMIEYP